MPVHNKLPVPEIGSIHNEWTVIKVSTWGKGKNIHPVFICEHKCGNQRKFTSSQIYHKKFKPCKTCEAGIYRAKDGIDIIINKEFRSYKYSAKQRGHDFKININTFRKLVLSKCKYCGREPQSEKFILKSRVKEWHKGQRYFLNGIDRVDNYKGYVDSNCVPCCTKCNMAKSTMSLDDWKIMVNLWYERLSNI